MKFSIPEPQVRGQGRITDPKTGEVTRFWIGSPDAVEPVSSNVFTREQKGKPHADSFDQRS